jgi:hypothetical protein
MREGALRMANASAVLACLVAIVVSRHRTLITTGCCNSRVVVAHVLFQFRIDQQLLADGDCPRFHVGTGIIDRHRQLEAPEDRTSISLGDSERLCMRVRGDVEPHAIVEARRLHDERIALPASEGVTAPGRVWSLNDLDRNTVDVSTRTRRQTTGHRIVLAQLLYMSTSSQNG